MNKRNSLLGSLMLHALLDGLNQRERRDPLEDLLGTAIPPTPLHAPVEVASLFLSTTPHRAPSADNIRKMANLIDQLTKLDLTKVDTLFVMALHQQDGTGEVCTGCGEVHDEPTQALFGGHVGHTLTRDAMYRVVTAQGQDFNDLPGVAAVRDGWDANGYGEAHAEAEQTSLRG